MGTSNGPEDKQNNDTTSEQDTGKTNDRRNLRQEFEKIAANLPQKAPPTIIPHIHKSLQEDDKPNRSSIDAAAHIG